MSLPGPLWSDQRSPLRDEASTDSGLSPARSASLSLFCSGRPRQRDVSDVGGLWSDQVLVVCGQTKCDERVTAAVGSGGAELLVQEVLQLGLGVDVDNEGRVDLYFDDLQFVVGAVERERAFGQAVLEKR
jgi:hypothetical protein